MDPFRLARDYECKLYSLRLLKQALDSNLISPFQYNNKQEEFLRVVNFHPQVDLDIPRKVAIKVQQMEDDLGRANTRGGSRGGPIRPPAPFLYSSERLKRIKRDHTSDGEFGSLDVLCKASHSSAYERGYITARYDAVYKLGSTACLKTIYKYAYDHQADIDSKYAYRFRDNEYKSNVRSTLHNTGAFTKLSNGDWTITGKLKSRKY